MFTAPGFTLSIFAAFFEVHKTSDLNGIRSSGIAPRRRDYKWRAPGVKNPSKNVARRVKDICFAVERLRSRPVYAREPPTSPISFYFSRASTNPERIGGGGPRTSQTDRSLSNRETFLFAARSARERMARGTTRGKIVKGNGSREIKRAGKCFIACPTHLPRLNERRPPSRCRL